MCTVNVMDLAVLGLCKNTLTRWGCIMKYASSGSRALKMAVLAWVVVQDANALLVSLHWVSEQYIKGVGENIVLLLQIASSKSTQKFKRRDKTVFSTPVIPPLLLSSFPLETGRTWDPILWSLVWGSLHYLSRSVVEKKKLQGSLTQSPFKKLLG